MASNCQSCGRETDARFCWVYGGPRTCFGCNYNFTDPIGDSHLQSPLCQRCILNPALIRCEREALSLCDSCFRNELNTCISMNHNVQVIPFSSHTVCVALRTSLQAGQPIPNPPGLPPNFNATQALSLHQGGSSQVFDAQRTSLQAMQSTYAPGLPPNFNATQVFDAQGTSLQAMQSPNPPRPPVFDAPGTSLQGGQPTTSSVAGLNFPIPNLRGPPPNFNATQARSLHQGGSSQVFDAQPNSLQAMQSLNAPRTPVFDAPGTSLQGGQPTTSSVAGLNFPIPNLPVLPPNFNATQALSLLERHQRGFSQDPRGDKRQRKK